MRPVTKIETDSSQVVSVPQDYAAADDVDRETMEPDKQGEHVEYHKFGGRRAAVEYVGHLLAMTDALLLMRRQH